MTATIRTFETGATRDLDASKLDYEGFLSPLVLERFAQYMHKNRAMSDGSLRDSDNWQRGIPPEAYMKSGFRHFFDWWKEHRGLETREGLEDAICALLFNAMGYLHERLKTTPAYEEQAVQHHAAEAPSVRWEQQAAGSFEVVIDPALLAKLSRAESDDPQVGSLKAGEAESAA